jgi:perosamine synthetase
MIPVYKPCFSGQEKKYVNDCLDSTWISSKGEFIGRFEKAFADYVGVNHATTVSNGTVAIHLALESIGLCPGDEVIVPTFTYIASVNTIIQAGATPVFVDSLEATWQINPEDVKAKITPRTKAIMVVHLYGLPCDMDALLEICREYGLYMIEDCAEAFGSRYKGKHVGTFGDIATFSFFGNKTITTGEGGMVVARDKNLIDKVYHLKNQGVSSVREYWHDALAYNYRMTNICAAIGLAQLEYADEILNKKRQIANWYREGLSNLPLCSHEEQANTTHSFWMCSILLDSSLDRDPLRDWLRLRDIETRPFFYPSHKMPHCYQEKLFPVADSLSSRGINLPSYPDLSKEQISEICGSIASYFEFK